MPSKFKHLLYILLATFLTSAILPVESGLCKSRLIKKQSKDSSNREVETNVISMLNDEDEEISWELNADQVDSLNQANILEAKGKVILKRGKEYLKADFARYFMDTKWIYLKGNVEIVMGKDELKAAEAEFDLANRTGWLKNGEVFMGGPHILFKGEQIQKHWGDVYSFRNAKVTACDGPSPAWSMSAEEAVVEIDGYARLWNTTFNIKDTAVAYTPVMLLPAKKTRQSGFLTPDFSYSTKKGASYAQPYFWAIDDSQDLTINTNIMFERGVMPGIEYRGAPSSQSNYWLIADWLKDSKTVTNADSYLYRGDNQMRTNEDRWWVRGMADLRLPDPRWRFKADLDLVSDQEYLQEFKRGRSGFHRTRDEFFNAFHRDFQEKDDARKSGVMLERDWERLGFNAGLSYTQNQYLGHGNAPSSSDNTAQALPEVNAFLYRGGVFKDVPLEVEAHAQATYFDRRSGSKGSRFDFSPKVIVPLASKYGAIVGTFGVRQTNYSNTTNGTSWITGTDGTVERGERSSKDSRTIPEFDLAANTEFMRVYPLTPAPLELTESNAGQSTWTGLRHSIQPRAGYRNTAKENQELLPYYNDEDRLEARNEVYYSITNVLTRKRDSVVLKKDDKGELIPELETDYLDVLRLRVEQAYDIREAGRTHDLEEYDRRAFSDVLTDLTISPSSYFSFYSKLWWSPEEGEITRSDQGVNIQYADWGSLRSGFYMRKALDEYKRKRKTNLRYAYIGGDINLGGPWVVGFNYARDIEGNSDVEKVVAVGYRHQCFFVTGEFSIEPDENSFSLFIELAGLGD